MANKIGYSPEGVNELTKIVNEKAAELNNTLTSFNGDVVTPLKDAWKGNDADKYIQELEELLTDTKKSINQSYIGMNELFRDIESKWINKQNGNDGKTANVPGNSSMYYTEK